MSRTLLPPEYIKIPMDVLKDKDISAAVFYTYCHLKSMAWGVRETPAFSMTQFAEMTGIHRSTLYGHLNALRDRGRLSYRPAESGLIIVTFSGQFKQDTLQSRNLDSPDLSLININLGNKDSQLKDSPTREKGAVQKTGQSRKLDRQVMSKADPRSKHPAILMAKGVGGGKYPPKELYDDIIRIVGDHPDGERAAACRKEWVKRGHLGSAWTWLVEWYVTGIPDNRNGRKPTQSRKTMLEGI